MNARILLAGFLILSVHSGRSAQKWTARLEAQKLNTKTHDVGFIVNCSFGNGYRLFPDEAYKQTMPTAAQSLTTSKKLKPEFRIAAERMLASLAGNRT